MRTVPLTAALCLAALLSPGCAGKGDDTGPTPVGPHAISFDGGPSCAAARVPSSGVPEAFTFEARVKADPNVGYDGHTFVVWAGVGALWQTADGFVVMTDTSGEVAGAAFPADVMDQGLHHVAGTWDGERMTVFVDGMLGAFSSAGAPGSTAGGTLFVGCWPGEEWNHQGIIDEVRVSSVVRYVDNFDVPQGAFVVDADTQHLWHVDEGRGESSADAAGNSPLDLTEIGWVSFALPDDAGGAASDSGR